MMEMFCICTVPCRTINNTQNATNSDFSLESPAGNGKLPPPVPPFCRVPTVLMICLTAKSRRVHFLPVFTSIQVVSVLQARGRETGAFSPWFLPKL